MIDGIMHTFAGAQIGKLMHLDDEVETYKAVKYNSAANTVETIDDGTTAGGDTFVGVVQSAYEAGQPVTVYKRRSGHRVKMIAGAAIPANTTKLSVDDNGDPIAYNAARFYLGVPTPEYIKSGVAVGQLFDVILSEDY